MLDICYPFNEIRVVIMKGKALLKHKKNLSELFCCLPIIVASIISLSKDCPTGMNTIFFAWQSHTNMGHQIQFHEKDVKIKTSYAQNYSGCFIKISNLFWYPSAWTKNPNFIYWTYSAMALYWLPNDVKNRFHAITSGPQLEEFYMI